MLTALFNVLSLKIFLAMRVLFFVLRKKNRIFLLSLKKTDVNK